MACNSCPELKIFVGDQTVFPVEITEDSGSGAVPVDITGHTLSWLISSSRDSGKLLQIDVSVHTNPSAGLSSLTITAANITAIGGEGTYWLTCVDVNAGVEITRVVAKLIVLGRIARS